MLLIFLHILLYSLYLPQKQVFAGENLYKTTTGKVSFLSYAQLESIKAQSNKLKGVVDIQKKMYAFSLPVNTFEGFNKSLQKTHFNENYLETDLYPTATFEGKILTNNSLEKDGTYPVKVVGKFNIHGITQEKMIDGKIQKKGNSLTIDADFPISLSDFNISIPKIVEFKIAKTVNVHVEANLIKS